jgi:hypothetical protein
MGGEGLGKGRQTRQLAGQDGGRKRSRWKSGKCNYERMTVDRKPIRGTVFLNSLWSTTVKEGSCKYQVP